MPDLVTMGRDNTRALILEGAIGKDIERYFLGLGLSYYRIFDDGYGGVNFCLEVGIGQVCCKQSLEEGKVFKATG